MKSCRVHLMPYRVVPEIIAHGFRSVSVDVPPSRDGGRKVPDRSSEYLGELALPGGHMRHLESHDAVADAAAHVLSS